MTSDLETLIHDRSLGAAALAEATARLLLLWADYPSSLPTDITQSVCAAHPAMAPLYYIHTRVEQVANQPKEIARLAKEWMGRIDGDRQEIAQEMAESTPLGAKIATHSRSSTVTAALLAASARVVAARSLPGGEGERLVQELLEHGVEAQLVEDEEIVHYLPSCCALWIGADAVGENSFLNKVGTEPLLQEAIRLKIEVVLLADTMKQVDDAFIERQSDPLFERIPLNLITRQVRGRRRANRGR